MNDRKYKVADIQPRMVCKVKQGHMVYTARVVRVDAQVVVVSLVIDNHVVEGPVKRTEITAAWWETNA